MLEPSLILPEKPRPLKRSEYDRLVAMGAFEDERVELLHELNMLLDPALVRVQSLLAAADESEPEPDLAIVPLGDYRRRIPTSRIS